MTATKNSDDAKIKLLQIVKLFCRDEKVRYALDKPFTHASAPGYVFASDTIAIIRVPEGLLPPIEPVPEGKSVPDPSGIINNDIINSAVYGATLERGAGRSVICDRCKGNGNVCSEDEDTEECEECGGDGTVECGECGSDKECPECEGSGKMPKSVKCPACKGKEKVNADVLRMDGMSELFYPRQIDRILAAFGGIPARMGIIPGKRHDRFRMAIFSNDEIVVALMSILDNETREPAQ